MTALALQGSCARSLDYIADYIEVKLEENSFNFQTGSPGNFPDKRKSPSNYRRDQRRRTPHGKGMPTPGNQGEGSVSPGDSPGAQKETIS